MDFFNISLADDYNVGMDFSPTTGGCRGLHCSANIVGECPEQLRVSGGCNSPCNVFGTSDYCCTNGSCRPTDYLRFFKTWCSDAYLPDDATSTSTCPGGTNYNVTFYPYLIRYKSGAGIEVLEEELKKEEAKF
ncbi:hypothetical protein ZIOFF_004657 [Zingiber officinale]|uniref:Uncharacterized protein n=1 Tax=Zingiber officinale TaxID=94328 RepID=A0A8J5I8P0_ZINOF|nr:hypothetical protein ZIOFF_004657 [Zingiber officinale]